MRFFKVFAAVIFCNCSICFAKKIQHTIEIIATMKVFVFDVQGGRRPLEDSFVYIFLILYWKWPSLKNWVIVIKVSELSSALSFVFQLTKTPCLIVKSASSAASIPFPSSFYKKFMRLSLLP